MATPAGFRHPSSIPIGWTEDRATAYGVSGSSIRFTPGAVVAKIGVGGIESHGLSRPVEQNVGVSHSEIIQSELPPPWVEDTGVAGVSGAQTRLFSDAVLPPALGVGGAQSDVLLP
jgi:hypothetical protein